MYCLTAELGLTDLDYYQYLSYGGNHKVEGSNDARDFQETLKGITYFIINNVIIVCKLLVLSFFFIFGLCFFFFSITSYGNTKL